jgi:hypothetical protein
MTVTRFLKRFRQMEHTGWESVAIDEVANGLAKNSSEATVSRGDSGSSSISASGAWYCSAALVGLEREPLGGLGVVGGLVFEGS